MCYKQIPQMHNMWTLLPTVEYFFTQNDEEPKYNICPQLYSYAHFSIAPTHIYKLCSLTATVGWTNISGLYKVDIKVHIHFSPLAREMQFNPNKMALCEQSESMLW